MSEQEELKESMDDTPDQVLELAHGGGVLFRDPRATPVLSDRSERAHRRLTRLLMPTTALPQ